MQESKKKVERFYDLIKIKSHFKSLLIFKSLVIACFALILSIISVVKSLSVEVK